MPDFIRFHDIFVIARMIAFIVIHLILQLPFLFGIRPFSGTNVRFFRGVCADDDGFQYGLNQWGTGLQAGKQHQEHCAQGQNQQDRRMTADAFHCFSSGIADLLRCFLCALCCTLNSSAMRASFGCGIFPANGTLLLPPGIGIAGELRVLLLVLLFHHTDIGFAQAFFRFFQLLIWTHFVGVIGVFTHLQS